MFRRRVEVILHAVKFSFLDMFVKKRNSLCLKVALMILFLLCLRVQLEVKGVTAIVEFQRFLGINNLVIEVENVVLEIVRNLDSSV